MQNRESRILERLKEAKDRGISIANLFNDNETGTMINTTLHRLRSLLGGSETIVSENGRWILSEEYFNVSKAEFREIMRNGHLVNLIRETTRDKNKISIATICIMTLLIIVFSIGGYLFGFREGMPTIEEVLIIYPELEWQNMESELQ